MNKVKPTFKKLAPKKRPRKKKMTEDLGQEEESEGDRVMDNGNATFTTITDDKRSAPVKKRFFVAAKNGNEKQCKAVLKATKNAIISHKLGYEDHEWAEEINEKVKNENTALHVASKHGHLEVVHLLAERGADIDARDYWWWTPLHFAASCGYVDIVKYLLAKDATVYSCNIHDQTPLHLAFEGKHWDVARELIEHGANMTARDHNDHTPLVLANDAEVVKHLLPDYIPVQTSSLLQDTDHMADFVAMVKEHYKHCPIVIIQIALDVALDINNTEIIKAIIESGKWKSAFSYSINSGPTGKRVRNTPLRKLVRKMPELAELVLDKCVQFCEKHPKDQEYYALFDYELIDDNFSEFVGTEDMARTLEEESEAVDMFHGCEQADVLQLSANRQMYTNSSTILKNNHTLMVMSSENRDSLVLHPLSLAVIRRKWRKVSIFYYVSVASYTVFLGFLSHFMLETLPPHLEPQNGTNSSSFCDKRNFPKSDFAMNAGNFLIVCCATGIIIELVQLISTKDKYVKQPNNWCDWFIYVSIILIVLDFRLCDNDERRTEWQWNLGVFTTFFAWMNFLMFLRRLPRIGIFVVMIEKIFNTFALFFSIFFLFIMAFSICFRILLSNQDPFSSYWKSLIKTWVMMIGEFDFNDLFHPEDPDAPDAIVYSGTTYAVFVAFLVLMAIIVMNLLTGLAVGDVEALREIAELKQTTMQLDFALDVEVTVPTKIQRWFKFTVRAERLFRYRPLGIRRFLSEIIVGSYLSKRTIFDKALSNKLAADLSEEQEKEKQGKDEKDKKTKQEISELKSEIIYIKTLTMNFINAIGDDLSEVRAEMSQLKDLMQAVSAHVSNQPPPRRRLPERRNTIGGPRRRGDSAAVQSESSQDEDDAGTGVIR